MVVMRRSLCCEWSEKFSGSLKVTWSGHGGAGRSPTSLASKRWPVLCGTVFRGETYSTVVVAPVCWEPNPWLGGTNLIPHPVK